MLYPAIFVVAIVAANLLTAHFGASFPFITSVNAFLLIGLDLSLRDRIHEAWRGRGLAWRMGAMILVAAALTYAVSADARLTAIASASAFALSSLADAAVYHRLIDRRFLVKANLSNVAGALVDSVWFPLVALSFLSPSVLVAVMVSQFIAKLLGGAVWSLVLASARRRVDNVIA